MLYKKTISLTVLCFLFFLSLFFCPVQADSDTTSDPAQNTAVYYSPGFVVHAEDGYYIDFNSFLYFFDTETGIVTPLCTRIDCLHAYETQWDKFIACDAYVGARCTGYMQYYDNTLYVIGQDETGDRIHYRLNRDGTKRETYTLPETNYVWEPAYHEGYLYDTIREVEAAGKGNVILHDQVRRYLPDAPDEAEVLFELDTRDISGFKVSGVQQDYCLYRDWLYFRVQADDLLSYDLYALNLSDGTLHEFSCPDEDARNIMIHGFDGESIIYTCYYGRESENGTLIEDDPRGGCVYRCNLDTSDPECIFTEEGSFVTFAAADENWIYTDNLVSQAYLRGGEDRYLRIYNLSTGELFWERNLGSMNEASVFFIGFGDADYWFYYTWSGFWAIDKKALSEGEEPEPILLIDSEGMNG